MSEFKITFEMDYVFQTRYKVVIEPGVIEYRDDVSSDYVTMIPIMSFDTGKRNGKYKTQKDHEAKLLDFITNKVIEWKCYYPNTILDSYAQWKLHIEYEGLEILTSGYKNELPENFNDLIMLINNCLPETKNGEEKWLLTGDEQDEED